MALTPSNMVPLGTRAPDFELSDVVTGELVSLPGEKEFKATVIMFICNHCPYVKHVQEELVRMVADYENRGTRFIAISSNDITSYPEDGPDYMRREAKNWNYTFPYLFDETQEVAQAYDAACTPDFYLFDEHLKLVYRGQLDDSRPGNGKPLDGKDLRSAIDDVLNDVPVSEGQKPSQGCNIKWK